MSVKHIENSKQLFLTAFQAVVGIYELHFWSSPRLLQHDRCRFIKCIVCCTLPALLPAAVGGGGPFSNALVSFANEGDFEWLQGHLTLPRGPMPSWWGNPPVCMCQGVSSLHESLFKSLHMVHFVLCCSISLTSICYGVQQKVGLLLIWSWLLERNTSEHLKGHDLEGGNGLRSGLDIYLYKQVHPVLFNNVKPTFVQGTPRLESYDCELVFV